MKNVLITDMDIKLSDDDYKTLEEFTDRLENGKKGKLDTEYQIKYDEIEKVILDEPDKGVQLFFINQKGKSEKTYIELRSLEEYTKIKDFIIHKTGFSKTEEQVGSFMAWGKPALYVLVAVAIGIGTYLMAVSLENGDEVTITGSRRGIKKILLFLAETLGSMGIIIVFGFIAAALVYRTFKAYQKSKIGMVVYRKV